MNELKSLTETKSTHPKHDIMADEKNKTLIIISGGSGTGKTTVANLLTQDPEIKKIITSTTREPRLGEEDKKDYYFITKEVFEQELDKNRFLEYTVYNQNYYGIHGKVVDLILTKEKKHGIAVVDVKGMKSLKAYCKDKNYQCYSFWLQAPNIETLINNLRKRGDADTTILNNLIIEEQENKKGYGKYDYTLINSDLEETVKKIKDKIFRNIGHYY